MKYTKTERIFALRMLKRAVRMAERDGNPFLNQAKLWSIMVEASHKGKSK